MACKPYTNAQFDAQDPTHISHHVRRVLARVAARQEKEATKK